MLWDREAVGFFHGLEATLGRGAPLAPAQAARLETMWQQANCDGCDLLMDICEHFEAENWKARRRWLDRRDGAAASGERVGKDIELEVGAQQEVC